MNRRTRTLLPMSEKLLRPRVINEENNMKQRLQRQAKNYNKSAKDLEPLQEGDVVRMKPLVQGQKNWQKAIVARRLDERSYVVETPTAIYRRNRVHLRKTQETPPTVPASQQQETLSKPNQNQQDTNIKTPQSSPKNQGKTTKNNPQEPRPMKTTRTSEQEPRPMKTTRTDQQEPRPMKTRINQQEPPGQDQELSTKSGRRIRRPSYLKDYVKS